MVNVNKKGAIELSIGTIIIIVLGVSMLILGMVLVRSIMCKAIGMTDDINGKVKDELNKYFGETNAEVVCIGAQGEPAKIAPSGKESYVICAINAPEQANYEFNVVSYETSITSLKSDTLKSWVIKNTYKQNIAAGDSLPKKVFTLKIPNSAPEGNVRLVTEIKKDGQLLSTQDIDLQISRVGFVQNTVC